MENFEFNIFYNGVTWTCEVENQFNEVIDHATGQTPTEALSNILKSKELSKEDLEFIHNINE
jgi:CRISPR/Cas system CMR-associated protein Cmr1 (group 7 of RAMP superfamily)